MRNSIHNGHVIDFHVAQESEQLLWAEYFSLRGDIGAAEAADRRALFHNDALNHECDSHWDEVVTIETISFAYDA